MKLTTSGSRVGDYLTTVRALAAIAGADSRAVALALTFELDRLTDSAPVQHLYYLPIIFGAVRFGAARRRRHFGRRNRSVLTLANPHLLTFRLRRIGSGSDRAVHRD